MGNDTDMSEIDKKAWKEVVRRTSIGIFLLLVGVAVYFSIPFIEAAVLPAIFEPPGVYATAVIVVLIAFFAWKELIKKELSNAESNKE